MLDLKQREVYGMKRETFGSRLGFILVSAGVPLASGMCGNSHICVDSLVELHLF